MKAYLEYAETLEHFSGRKAGALQCVNRLRALHKRSDDQ